MHTCIYLYIYVCVYRYLYIHVYINIYTKRHQYIVMKYLELVFVTIYFDTTISLTIISQIFIYFFSLKNFSFAIFVSPNLNIIILSKKKKKKDHYFLAN